jgi:hypothetical protein
VGRSTTIVMGVLALGLFWSGWLLRLDKIQRRLRAGLKSGAETSSA